MGTPAEWMPSEKEQVPQAPDIQARIIDPETVELPPGREAQIEALAAKMGRDAEVMKMQEREKIARELMADAVAGQHEKASERKPN